MTDNVRPPWLQAAGNHSGDDKRKPKGNPAWYPGMPSPNPAGRPRGIVDKRTRITQALAKDAEEIVKVVTAAARSGDLQACGLILARVAPALKSESERVQFDFDATAPLTEQVQSVLQAIADGNVSVDVGKQIIEAIASLGAIRQYDDLEARIRELEERFAA